MTDSPPINEKRARAAEIVVEKLSDLHEDDDVEDLRGAALAIVRLRETFEHDGRPDWFGRSDDYRDLIQRLYRQVEVPSDSESSVQGKLRYQLGIMMRKVAPPEDLEAIA